jgi:hypothetical protein
MWLLDTDTLQLRLVYDGDEINYAILSHTWGDGEVTFQHMQDLATARLMPGFAKIESTCRIARSKGFNYCWVDTCCIDKTSSAELSEAINSMFRWYKQSKLCYVYLFDVDGTDNFVGVHFLRLVRGKTWQATGEQQPSFAPLLHSMLSATYPEDQVIELAVVCALQWGGSSLSAPHRPFRTEIPGLFRHQGRR